MREILFRGKKRDNGEWAYGDLCQVLPGCECKFNLIFSQEECATSSIVLPETVGQSTGIIDKNGRKIFEGDIIKIVPDCDYSDDYNISKVYSYNGIFCVDYHGDDFDSTALGFLEDYLPDGDFEVIGNIHDNPELLEEKE